MKSIPIEYVHSKESMSDQRCCVRGRIINLNIKSDQIHYYLIHDESGYLRVKNRLSKGSPEVNKGDIVQVSGVLTQDKNGFTQLDAKRISVATRCEERLPNEAFFRRLSNRMEYRHLEALLDHKVIEFYRKRANLLSRYRGYLEGRGFIEISTGILREWPILSGARSFETFWVNRKKDLYLRKEMESGLKKLIIGGFEKIYEVGKVFRNEGSSKNHLSELTTIDVIQAFSDYNDMMDMSEELFQIACEVFEVECHIVRLSFQEGVTTFNVANVNYSDSYNKLKKAIKKTKWSGIIYELPAETSPSAKLVEGNKEVAEHFMVFFNGLNIGHGYSFETDWRRLKAMERNGVEDSTDDTRYDVSFCEALSYGMPPSAGIGLGLERVLKAFSGKSHIKDVTMFTV